MGGMRLRVQRVRRCRVIGTPGGLKNCIPAARRIIYCVESCIFIEVASTWREGHPVKLENIGVNARFLSLSTPGPYLPPPY